MIFKVLFKQKYYRLTLMEDALFVMSIKYLSYPKKQYDDLAQSL